MKTGKDKKSSSLLELIAAAKGLNIEVRTEKLLREVGYRAHSGYCRVNGQDLIIIDRDAPVEEQLELLSVELNRRAPDSLPPREDSKK